MVTVNAYHLAWGILGAFSFGYLCGIWAEKNTPKDGINLHKKK